jgi:prenyl protein peptidase
MPIITALLMTLLQVSYTTVFGCMATILLMRTGNLLSPTLSHVICNIIGLPDFGFMYKPGIHGTTYSFVYAYRHVLLVLHISGLVFFALLLFPLTAITASSSPLWV